MSMHYITNHSLSNVIRSLNSSKDKWCQKTYGVIMTEYKAVLKLWYKGTGGGSGNTSMFEDWTKEKLDKYDIDPNLYDHTIVNQ